MPKLTITGIDKTRKHRVHTWIDTATLEPMYGIQANVARLVWSHVLDEGKIILFPTKEEATATIKAWKSEAAA